MEKDGVSRGLPIPLGDQCAKARMLAESIPRQIFREDSHLARVSPHTRPTRESWSAVMARHQRRQNECEVEREEARPELLSGLTDPLLSGGSACALELFRLPHRREKPTIRKRMRRIHEWRARRELSRLSIFTFLSRERPRPATSTHPCAFIHPSIHEPPPPQLRLSALYISFTIGSDCDGRGSERAYNHRLHHDLIDLRACVLNPQQVFALGSPSLPYSTYIRELSKIRSNRWLSLWDWPSTHSCSSARMAASTP